MNGSIPLLPLYDLTVYKKKSFLLECNTVQPGGDAASILGRGSILSQKFGGFLSGFTASHPGTRNIKRRCRVARTVAPYMGGPAFKYRHGDQLTRLTFIFLQNA